MTTRAVCSLAAAGILASSTAFAAGPFGSVQVGNWQGGAYTNDTTGAFSHCAAGTTYQSGIYFLVSVNGQGGWSLGFSHPSWQLTQGETIPIDLTFNGQSQFHVFGTSPSPTLVVVPMPTNSALIAEFRKSTYMAATANGQLYQFNLDATSQLLPALSECVSQNKAGVTAHIKVQKTKPPAPAVASAKTEQPAATTAPSADLQIEAIELATNFILKTQLHNPKVLSRAQTPVDLASFGAAWISDEATGTVTILLPRGNTKGIDIAAAVAGSDARQCRGKFASGRVSELVDSDVVFRGFSTCEDSAGSRVAQYFIVPRGRGGFVIFSLVSNMNTEASRKVTRDESLGDFRKAALTVVTP